MLGFKSEISMEQGLSDLVAWWRHEKMQNTGEAA
jgi:UDP-glucose 4-epimerase